jgi:hypothetical protein
LHKTSPQNIIFIKFLFTSSKSSIGQYNKSKQRCDVRLPIAASSQQAIKTWSFDDTIDDRGGILLLVSINDVNDNIITTINYISFF